MCLPLLLASALCLPLPAGQDPAPVNVVWIVADDAGWADFGFQGGPVVTPRLDAFAREGVRCAQAYVSASVCSPSRAGLLTGRYQQRFGHEFNLPRKPLPPDTVAASGMDVGERTVADHMRAAGYATGAIGKWHLGMAEHFHPLARGFDDWYGFRLGSRGYFSLEGEPGVGVRLERGREAAPEAGYLTDVFADEAARFIAGHGDEPFFLYLAFNAVHGPMHATEEDLAAQPEDLPEKRRKLLAMTAALDRGVGRVLDALETAGVAERTLVVFVNDNGGATNNASDNGPLRGRKGDHFEGGIRVPMVLRWPGVLPAGTDYAHPVSALDLLPTALAAAGRERPGNLDGVDLAPFLRGERSERPHRHLFWRRGPIATVREGDLKLVRVEGHGARLFDLAADPAEQRDLAASSGEDVTRLLDVLETWERGLVAPRWRTEQVWRRKQVEIHAGE